MDKNCIEAICYRDLIEREKAPQLSYHIFSNLHRCAISRHEGENRGGYSDLFIYPNFSSFPGARYSALIEFKYLTVKEAKSKTRVNAALDEAVAQLQDYSLSRYLELAHGSKILKGVLLYAGKKLCARKLLG